VESSHILEVIKAVGPALGAVIVIGAVIIYAVYRITVVAMNKKTNGVSPEVIQFMADIAANTALAAQFLDSMRQSFESLKASNSAATRTLHERMDLFLSSPCPRATKGNGEVKPKVE